jgi:hypothetical protein
MWLPPFTLLPALASLCLLGTGVPAQARLPRVDNGGVADRTPAFQRSVS